MSRSYLASAVIGAFLMVTPGAAAAQQAKAEQLSAYAKAYTAIAQLRDQFEAEFAQPRNKKLEAQQQLQDKLRLDVARALQANGLTEQQYNQLTFALSTDPELRGAFDQLLGIAPPQPVPAPAAAQLDNPHLTHIRSAFSGTPNGEGLLPMALAEAAVVTQHAALAVRSATLEAMQLHAGHVLHAIEPAAAATGPGKGFGLQKAAAAIASHAELAARTPGATDGIRTHAPHVAAAARNTAQRAEQVAALARQVLSAASPGAARDLLSRLHTLAQQLVPGTGSERDGTGGWGLQQVEQHLALMSAAR